MTPKMMSSWEQLRAQISRPLPLRQSSLKLYTRPSKRFASQKATSQNDQQICSRNIWHAMNQKAQVRSPMYPSRTDSWGSLKIPTMIAAIPRPMKWMRLWSRTPSRNCIKTTTISCLARVRQPSRSLPCTRNRSRFSGSGRSISRTSTRCSKSHTLQPYKLAS